MKKTTRFMFLWLALFIWGLPLSVQQTCTNPTMLTGGCEGPGILEVTRTPVAPIPMPQTRDVCFDSITTVTTDLQLAAQIACFENRRNENNGFRVYRCQGSATTTRPDGCFIYDFSTKAMCSEECFDDCYAEPTDNPRDAAAISITCNDVDECNDGTFSNCMGAQDVSCTRGDACGANMDCNNFPGGYNCTCSDGFVTDPQDSSSCVLNSCGHPETDSHAMVSFIHYDGGFFSILEIAQFTCESGYHVQENVQGWNETCIGGEWVRPNISLCQNIDECAGETNPCGTHTCVDLPGFYVCQCATGFTRNTSAEICEADQCQALPAIENAAPGGMSDTFGEMVTFTCAIGYVPAILGRANTDNTFELTCSAERTWRLSTSPSCVRLSCGSPSVFPNTYFTASDELYESMTVYNCMDGTQLPSGINSFSSVCQNDGTWSEPTENCTDIDECSDDPTLCGNMECINIPGSYICMAITLCPQCNSSAVLCGFPGSESHTNLQPTDLSPGSVATYQCEDGYEVSPGVNTYQIMCQPDGEWTTSIFSCKDINECEEDRCGMDQCFNINGSFLCLPSRVKACSAQGQCENGGSCIVLPDGRPHCICPEGYAGQRCEVFLTSIIGSSLIGIAAFVLSLAHCLLFGICLCSRHPKREQVQQVIQRPLVQPPYLRRIFVRLATRTNPNNAVFRMPINSGTEEWDK